MIETTLENIIDNVEKRFEEETLTRVREAISTGKEYVEPKKETGDIMKWLLDEVQSQQQVLVNQGYTIGFNLEDHEPRNEATNASYELVHRNVCLCAQVVISRLNDEFHEKNNNNVEWFTVKGKRLSARFLYVLAWKCWNDEINDHVQINSCATWESIFGPSLENCAIMAIQAKVNSKMSEIARKQG